MTKATATAQATTQATAHLTFDHTPAEVAEVEREMAERALPLAAPPDDASDLWGWPPRKPVVCPGCGLRAEPYIEPFCWFCVTTGREAFIRATHPARYLTAGG